MQLIPAEIGADCWFVVFGLQAATFKFNKIIMIKIYEIDVEMTQEEEAETYKILNELGFTQKEVIEMFFAEVRRTKSIPFSIMD